jgi:hypothetical protein
MRRLATVCNAGRRDGAERRAGSGGELRSLHKYCRCCHLRRSARRIARHRGALTGVERRTGELFSKEIRSQMAKVWSAPPVPLIQSIDASHPAERRHQRPWSTLGNPKPIQPSGNDVAAAGLCIAPALAPPAAMRACIGSLLGGYRLSRVVFRSRRRVRRASTRVRCTCGTCRRSASCSSR